MFSYSKKHKSLRYFFAYVLSWVMVLSNLSYMQVQATTVSDGDAQIMQVNDDGVASVSNNNSGEGNNEVGALETPVVEIAETQKIDAETGTITLNWQSIASADYYQLYRYSDDQSEAEADCLAERLTTNTYVDTVEVDMPYYYYVKAVSEATNNESPYSATIWGIVTSSRTAHRVIYGAETEDIFLTKKSYDTVFTNKATVEGIVYANGTLTVMINGNVVEEAQVTEGSSFSYELTLNEGRNNVELHLIKETETTRRALNFVYLTNYDMIVDASYEGTDGDVNEKGIPTYKTVQAAVNSVPSDNADSKVILVMAGSYEERLEVNTPSYNVKP